MKTTPSNEPKKPAFRQPPQREWAQELGRQTLASLNDPKSHEEVNRPPRRISQPR